MLLTIEFRTDERNVAGFDNLKSKPEADPSPSNKAESEVEVLVELKLSEGCQLKSIKSLLNALKTDIYELAPKRLDERVRLGESPLAKT